MSYDLTLYRVAPGADAAAVARMDPGETDTRPLLEWDEPLRLRLTAALQSLHEWEIIGTELTDETSGIQINFYDREVSVTVPYWHRGDDAATRVFDLIWRCLRALTESTGAVAYDPQLDRVLDLNTDQPRARRVYEQGAGAPADAGPVKRPWWRFW